MISTFQTTCRYRLLSPGKALVFAVAMAAAVPAVAMQEMAEDDLRESSGAGLALPFENFRMQMAPTSFIELTGAAPGGGTTFLRGDVRYYGLAMSRGANSAGVIYNTDGRDSAGNSCTGGTYGLGCAQTLAGIENFSNVDNPYLLRVFDYNKILPTGSTGDLTVLEFIGPSNTDAFRWSFWGEIEAGRTVDVNGARTGATCTGATNDGCILQSQSIILGKPVAYQKSYTRAGTTNNPLLGPVLRMFQDPGTLSLGLNYASRLSGDFRFSVNKAAGVSFGVAPDFTDEEGLYFRNVHAYLPLGQMHYQAITFNDTQDNAGTVTTNGNFVIELSSIPDVSGVYNDFYSLPDALEPTTQCNPACQAERRGYNRTIASTNTRYYETHGYVSWGDKFPTCPPGTTNCLAGTGVSSQRFSGNGDGVPATVTIAARVINSTNFTGNLCTDAFGQAAACTEWSNETAPAVTVNTPTGRVSATGTKGDILAAGGVSFVARSGGSWSVLNNQNLPQTTIPVVSSTTLQDDLDVMRARTNYSSCNIFGASCNRLVLQSPPDAAAIQGRANALFAYPANYNPLISVDAINLGSARFEGLQFNHLKITSLGASL